MSESIVFWAFIVQIGIFLPLQGLLYFATKREKEEVKFIIKEGLKQSLRVIMTRRGGL